MIIRMDSLRKYQKQISAFLESGSMFYESAYLNFKDSYILFTNSKAYLKIKTEFKDNDGSFNNVFIDASKLLILATQFDSLTVEKTSKDGEEFYTLKNEKNKFKLKQFFEDVEYDSVFEDDYVGLDIKITDIIYNHLTKIPNYIESTTEGLFGAFFVKDESEKQTLIIGTNKRKFYQFYTSYENVNSDSEFWIDGNILSYMRVFSENYDNLSFNVATNKIKLALDNDFEAVFSIIKDLSFPVDVTSNEFKANYNKENYIDIKIDTILNAVKFLDSFVKDIPDSKIQFVANDEEITLNVIFDNVAETKIPFENKNFEGEVEFWISQNYLKQSILDILSANSSSENIRVTFDKNEVKLLKIFSIENYEKEKHSIIFSTL